MRTENKADEERTENNELLLWAKTMEVKGFKAKGETKSGYLYLPKKLVGKKVVVMFGKKEDQGQAAQEMVENGKKV